MAGRGGNVDGAINGFAGAPSLPAKVTMPGIFVGGAPLDNAASASYKRCVDGTACASSGWASTTRFSSSSSRGSATSSSKTIFVIVPSRISFVIVFVDRRPRHGTASRTWSQRLIEIRQALQQEAAAVRSHNARRRPGRVEAVERQDGFVVARRVSAALSCTLRFFRNHTAVVMARTDVAEGERIRRSDVVVLKCSLSWLMSDELSSAAACVACCYFVADSSQGLERVSGSTRTGYAGGAVLAQPRC